MALSQLVSSWHFRRLTAVLPDRSSIISVLPRGGLKSPPVALNQHPVRAPEAGVIGMINNRILSRLASLAGAPNAPAAGIDLHVKVDDIDDKGQVLMTLHAEASGELAYALDFYKAHPEIFHIEQEVI